MRQLSERVRNRCRPAKWLTEGLNGNGETLSCVRPPANMRAGELRVSSKSSVGLCNPRLPQLVQGFEDTITTRAEKRGYKDTVPRAERKQII
jgi:hypothetical protein